MAKLIKIILILVAVIIGGSFAVLNQGSIAVDFYFFTTELSLSIALLMALGVGLLIGLIVGLLFLARSRAELASVRRQARIAAQEVNNLRVIPVKDR